MGKLLLLEPILMVMFGESNWNKYLVYPNLQSPKNEVKDVPKH